MFVKKLYFSTAVSVLCLLEFIKAQEIIKCEINCPGGPVAPVLAPVPAPNPYMPGPYMPGPDILREMKK